MDNLNRQNTDNSPVCENIRLDQISPPAFQPRRYFDEAAMAELTASVQQHGILQPILVRPLGPNQYELVTGERRYKAAKAVGLTQMPVVVRQMSDAEAMQYALMENLQREDLNPVKETEALLHLLELSLDTDKKSVISLLNRMANKKRGITDTDVRKQDWDPITSIFTSLGKGSPESFRTYCLPVLNLPPENLEAVRQQKIKPKTAKSQIAKIQDIELRGQIFQEAIGYSLSFNEVKEHIDAEKQFAKRNELQTHLDAIPQKIKKMWALVFLPYPANGFLQVLFSKLARK